MKKHTALKILVVLIVIALCLISFIGIYTKKQNQSSNLVPNFLLGMNLKGARVATIIPDTSTKKVYYDAEGKKKTEGTDSEGKLKEGYTEKEEKVNKEEVLTSENYAKMKNIIEERLKGLGVEEYIVKADQTTGNMVIEIPEATNTDEVISNLTYVGKFEIQDSSTGEVLMDNTFVKSAKAVYNTADSGTKVYLSIEFNQEGKTKLEEISKTYIKSEDAEGKDTSKKVAIKIDDEDLVETYFGDTMSNGVLQLSIGSASTSADTINQYLKQASNIATLIDSGNTQVKYKLQDNRYMEAAIGDNILKIVVYVAIAILIAIAIYFIVKYRANGILAIISLTGFIATLFVVLRYTNVIISLESIVAIATVVIANVFFLRFLLNNSTKEVRNIKQVMQEAYIRYASILVPLLIIAITFAFTKWTPVASIGMVMFWGIAIMLVYHYLITRTLLLDTIAKKKE